MQVFAFHANKKQLDDKAGPVVFVPSRISKGASPYLDDLLTEPDTSMARLQPREQLASTHSALKTELANTTIKYNYASAVLKAATAQWERINASSVLCADLLVKKAKILAEQAGWQRELMEVDDRLCDTKEQESGTNDLKSEATQLRAKKELLKALLEKVPEALQGVELLVGPAVSSSSCLRGSWINSYPRHLDTPPCKVP